jgi:hypothetical protein
MVVVVGGTVVEVEGFVVVEPDDALVVVVVDVIAFGLLVPPQALMTSPAAANASSRVPDLRRVHPRSWLWLT